jgi:hypothetical protein
MDMVAGDLVKEDPVVVVLGRRVELDFGRRIEANAPLLPGTPVRVLVVADAAAAAAAMLPPDPEFLLSRNMVLEPVEFFLSRVMVLEPLEIFRVSVELEPGRIFLPNISPLLTLLMDFRPEACPGACRLKLEVAVLLGAGWERGATEYRREPEMAAELGRMREEDLVFIDLFKVGSLAGDLGLRSEVD